MSRPVAPSRTRWCAVAGALLAALACHACVDSAPFSGADAGDVGAPGDASGAEASPGCAAGCEASGPCVTATCVAGQCREEPRLGACDDGDACTANDACELGVCRAGTVISCDDGIACTIDTCDPADGCRHVPAEGQCPADADPCTAAVCDAASGCKQAAVGDFTACIPAASPDDCTWDACVQHSCGVARKQTQVFDGALRTLAATPEGFVAVGSKQSTGVAAFYRGDGTLASEATVGTKVNSITAVRVVDGGLVLAGQADTDDLGAQGWLARTDATGQVLWQERYGGAFTDGFEDVLVNGAAGFVVVGRASSAVAQSYPWVLIVDADGAVLHEAIVTDHGVGRANGVLAVADGFAWVGTLGGTPLPTVAVAGRVSEAGEVRWTADFGGSFSRSGLASLIGSTNDTTVLAGYAALATETMSQARLLKVDAGGTATWDYRYAELTQSYRLVTTSDGFALAGSQPSASPIYTDACLLWTDAAGQGVRVQSYPGEPAVLEWSADVAWLPDGGLAVLTARGLSTALTYLARSDGTLCPAP